MKIQKIYKKIDNLLKSQYEEGWENGYECCMDSNGVEKAYNDGNDNGIDIGIKLEQERIVELLVAIDKNKTHSRSTECVLCQVIELIKGEK